MRSAALHDRAIAGRAWTAVMSREQVLDQGVDSAVAFATQFGVFVDRKILGPASLLRLKKRSRSFAPELFEFLALHSSCHVYSDCTQRLNSGKST